MSDELEKERETNEMLNMEVQAIKQQEQQAATTKSLVQEIKTASPSTPQSGGSGQQATVSPLFDDNMGFLSPSPRSSPRKVSVALGHLDRRLSQQLGTPSTVGNGSVKSAPSSASKKAAYFAAKYAQETAARNSSPLSALKNLKGSFDY